MRATHKTVLAFILTGIVIVTTALSFAWGAEAEFKVISTDQLKAMMYARHGRELMGCKSPVRESEVE